MSAPKTAGFAIDISKGGQQAGLVIAEIAVKTSELFAPDEQAKLMIGLLGGVTCHIYKAFGSDALEQVLAAANEARRQVDAKNSRGMH